jgi:hypothetical protein
VTPVSRSRYLIGLELKAVQAIDVFCATVVFS